MPDQKSGESIHYSIQSLKDQILSLDRSINVLRDSEETDGSIAMQLIKIERDKLTNQLRNENKKVWRSE